MNRNAGAVRSFSMAMGNKLEIAPAEELRRRAAHYRTLARECGYPEGVDLLLMMADVHEDEAALAVARSEADAPLVARPVPSSR